MTFILTNTILFSLPSTSYHSQSDPLTYGGKEQKSLINSLRNEGLPVYIESASAVNRAASKIKYSLRNVGNTDVSVVEVRVVVSDRVGRIKTDENKETTVDLVRHGTADTSFYLNDKLQPDDSVLLILWRVIEDSGVWTVDSRNLARLINSGPNTKMIESLTVKYTPNINLSEEDQTEILNKVLRLILQSARLQDLISFEKSRCINISTENIVGILDSSVAGYQVKELDPERIQEAASNTGELMYFHFLPLEVEGSVVRVTIEYSRAFSGKAKGKYVIPCCGGHTFEFHKRQDGKWIGKHIATSRI
jgi:hypothetical protein